MNLTKMKYLTLSLLFIFGVNLCAKAEMRVSPTKFIYEVNKKQKYVTGSLELEGMGSEPSEYKIYTGYFEGTKYGQMTTEFPTGYKKQDITQVFINPQQVSLNPKQKQIVRFTIPNIDKLPDGESRLALYIEDKKTRTQALPSPSSKINASLVLRTRFAVPVYVSRGNLTKRGNIENLAVNSTKDKSYEYDLKVASRGNSHIRVTGVVQLICKNKIVQEDRINDLAVPVGNIREIAGVFDPKLIEANKSYKVKSKIYYVNEHNKKVILTKEVKLSPETT